MADKLKELQTKVLEWWNKFTSKQKTIIVGMTAVVVFAFVILFFVFNKEQYSVLTTCSNTAESSKIIEILEGADITYQTSQGGLRIEVPTEKIDAANLAMGAAGYVPDDWSLEDALSGGISATSSDKEKKYVEFLGKKLEKTFSNMEGVKSAIVQLNIPPQDGTLIAKTVESSAYIHLVLDGEFTAEQAAAMARATATALHNETTANITIMDNNGNLLFSGEEDYTVAGKASSLLELRNQASNMIASQVRKVLLGTNEFNNIEVASNLDIDASEYERLVNEYYAPDGHDQGMITQQSEYESENTNSNGGVPGTDSNNETTTMYQNNGESSSSETERETQYQPNSSTVRTMTPAGAINYDNSSITVTALSYHIVNEEDIERQGLLDGTSWEDYKLANNERVKLEVDEDFYTAVSTATGIGRDRITILAYEEPLFNDAPPMDVDWTNILSIVLLILILALLAFVVLRSMRSKRVVEEPEEVSVDNMLQSLEEEQIEDISLENKSETRKMIEKFVDENPEAAANLLRNWLNEDWG